MATILPVNGKEPQFGENCFIAPNATIVGEVTMGADCSIWFNAVIRGDVHYIKMGDKVNVQDGAIIHCTYQKHPTNIGNNVSIGHNAMVHGCTIHDNVLIGMGSIVMDACVVHSNAIIAAGAVVLEGTIVEAGSIYAGVPAKKVKMVSEDLIHGEINRISNNYVKYALHGFGRWAVVQKSTGKFIGWCGLKYSATIDEVDIGFRFFKAAWNQGFATEAAKKCIQLGFDSLGIKRIVGRAMVGNIASIKVLEKIGLTFLKEFDFDGEEGAIYEIVYNEKEH